MPNNMDLLGIRHQNLETTPSQNRFHCLRHSFGKGIVDLDIGHSTHRFLPGAIYAMLGNSRWNQLQPSKFVVTDVTELGWSLQIVFYTRLPTILHCDDNAMRALRLVSTFKSSWFRSFSSKRWLDSAQLDLVEHDVFLPLFLSIYNVIICNCIILYIYIIIYIYTVCIDARSFWIILSLLILILNQLPSLLHLPAPSAIVFEQKRGTNL